MLRHKMAFLIQIALCTVAGSASADCLNDTSITAAIGDCAGQSVAIFFANGHSQVQGTVVSATDSSATIDVVVSGVTNRLLVPYAQILYLQWQH
jgi:hypothetical protein